MLLDALTTTLGDANPYTIVLSAGGSILAIILGKYIYDVKRGHSTWRNLKSPPSLPLLGSSIPLVKNLDRFFDWAYEFDQHVGEGVTWTFRLPGLPRYFIINSVEGVEHVLKSSFLDFEKGETFHEWFEPLLGDGIFNSDGKAWQLQRKAAAHIFTTGNFRTFFMSVFEENFSHFNRILSQTADSGTVIDLHHLLHRSTLDSFVKIAFAGDLKCLETYAAGNESPVPFMTAFDQMQEILAQRSLSPAWSLVEHFTGAKRTLKENVKYIDDFAYGLIRKYKEEQEGTGLVGKGSMLARFMAMTGDDGKPLYNDRELRDVLLNMVLAGRDTTAQVYVICQPPFRI
ncbi:hypothetical protein HK104_006843 [Borealophlyctis nickersoniae]|nr:hypothetical protein HK104_006843 [Borealophlyctis nickersoniae]